MKYNFNRKVDVPCGKYTLHMGTKTYIMGILNVTPDSFSDGGSYVNVDTAIEHAKQMIKDGADIIDIGGESTRPGSAEVDAAEELRRVLPVVEKLVQEINVPISVDTYKAEVADQVLSAGAHMINDVWGLQRDPDLANIVAKHNAPIIVMHNQIGTAYEKDIMEEISTFLKKSIHIALEAGVEKEKII